MVSRVQLRSTASPFLSPVQCVSELPARISTMVLLRSRRDLIPLPGKSYRRPSRFLLGFRKDKKNAAKLYPLLIQSFKIIQSKTGWNFKQYDFSLLEASLFNNYILACNSITLNVCYWNMFRWFWDTLYVHVDYGWIYSIYTHVPYSAKLARVVRLDMSFFF